MRRDLEALLRESGGVILSREQTRATGRYLVRQVDLGRLAAPLRGAYVAGEHGDDPLARCLAAQRLLPDAVITGAMSARLTFWPEIRVGSLQLANVRHRPRADGFTFEHRRVPAELVGTIGPLRCLDPALTALDLASDTDGESIDRALRTRTATLTRMKAALAATPHRPGNLERARWLLDSRDEPWSRAERHAHRVLREHAVTGWRSNLPVRVKGRTYFLDIAFAEELLAVEIDGREHHSDAAAFEADRARQNALVLAGWRVLRFTWAMVTAQPDSFLAAIRSARGQCASPRLPAPSPR